MSYYPLSTVRLTADLSGVTSTTLTDTTGLSFFVKSGIYYKFIFLVAFQSTSVSDGLKVSLTTPSFTAFSATARIPLAADSTNAEWVGFITASDVAVTAVTVPSANTTRICEVIGIILPSSDGTLQVRHAASTGMGTLTIKRASLGILHPV